MKAPPDITFVYAAWICNVAAQSVLAWRWRARSDAWLWLLVVSLLVTCTRVWFNPIDRAAYRLVWTLTQPVHSAAMLAAALSLPNGRNVRWLSAGAAGVSVMWLALLSPRWHDSWTQTILFARDAVAILGLFLSIGAAIVPHPYRWFALVYFGTWAAQSVALQALGGAPNINAAGLLALGTLYCAGHRMVPWKPARNEHQTFSHGAIYTFLTITTPTTPSVPHAITLVFSLGS